MHSESLDKLNHSMSVIKDQNEDVKSKLDMLLDKMEEFVRVVLDEVAVTKEQ